MPAILDRFHRIFVKDNTQAQPLSGSSRFNIRFMKRTNMLAIFMFVFGILGKIIYNYFFKG
jgi:hypothetical protein